jgi:hypothetical protein
MKPMELTYTRTVKTTFFESEVYRRIPEGSTPNGFERTGEFRPPNKGEYFLDTIKVFAITAIEDFPDDMPYIILRPKKKKQIVFTEVGYGYAKDEQYIWDGSAFIRAGSYGYGNSSKTTIYEREDREI